MDEEQSRYIFYIAIKRSDDGMVERLLRAGSLDKIRALASKKDDKPAAAEEALPNMEPEPDPVAFRLVMRRVVEALHSQSELLWTGRIMGPVTLMVENNRSFADPITKSGVFIEAVSDLNIYGVDEELFQELSPALERMLRLERGLLALPAALLMSIVATFDANMADIVRTMLRLKTDSLHVGTKTVLATEVLRASSLEELKEKLITEEIYQFSRGSHEEQVQYIEKHFHIHIMKDWKRWPDFIEIFERRNLVAHGEKKFTDRCVEICKRHNHKGIEKNLGTPIKLTHAYLLQTIEILLEFSILLVFSLWKKHASKEERAAFENLNHTAFGLIEQKEYTVAIRVLEYAAGLKNVDLKVETRQMIIVNLASAYAHDKNTLKCNDVLDGYDWSGSSDNFKICVAALKKDVKEACRLLPIVSNSGSIKANDVRSWPVFDFIRDQTPFAEKFQDVFGQPLLTEPSPSFEPEIICEAKEGESAPDPLPSKILH